MCQEFCPDGGGVHPPGRHPLQYDIWADTLPYASCWNAILFKIIRLGMSANWRSLLLLLPSIKHCQVYCCPLSLAGSLSSYSHNFVQFSNWKEFCIIRIGKTERAAPVNLDIEQRQGIKENIRFNIKEPLYCFWFTGVIKTNLPL